MVVKLHEELKQSKPFSRVEEEALVSISRTAAVLERTFAQMLKPHGLTPTQYNVLRILRGAGPAGLCRNEVGCRLVTPVPDVTRLLDRMAAMKLIARQRTDTDRRLVRTHLTSKGLALVDRLDGTIAALLEERVAPLGRQKLTVLVDALAQLRNAGD